MFRCDLYADSPVAGLGTGRLHRAGLRLWCFESEHSGYLLVPDLGRVCARPVRQLFLQETFARRGFQKRWFATLGCSLDFVARDSYGGSRPISSDSTGRPSGKYVPPAFPADRGSLEGGRSGRACPGSGGAEPGQARPLLPPSSEPRSAGKAGGTYLPEGRPVESEDIGREPP